MQEQMKAVGWCFIVYHGLIAAFGAFFFLVATGVLVRILAVVVGALHLLSFPVGTALGFYALWVLLNRNTLPLIA